jgi:hypothetical protein
VLAFARPNPCKGLYYLGGFRPVGLDTVLLTLKDIADSYDDMGIDMLKGMTQGEGKGLSKIRESYLDTKMELNADSKALLVSSTNHMPGLKAIFGSIGENYRNISVMNG